MPTAAGMSGQESLFLAPFKQHHFILDCTALGHRGNPIGAHCTQAWLTRKKLTRCKKKPERTISSLGQVAIQTYDRVAASQQPIAVPVRMPPCHQSAAPPPPRPSAARSLSHVQVLRVEHRTPVKHDGKRPLGRVASNCGDRLGGHAQLEDHLPHPRPPRWTVTLGTQCVGPNMCCGKCFRY